MEIDHVEPLFGLIANRVQVRRQIVSVSPFELGADLVARAERFRPGVKRLVLKREHVVEPRDRRERLQGLFGPGANLLGVLGRIDARVRWRVASEQLQPPDLGGDDHPLGLGVVQDPRGLVRRSVGVGRQAGEAVLAEVVDRVAERRLVDRTGFALPSLARGHRRKLGDDRKEIEPAGPLERRETLASPSARRRRADDDLVSPRAQAGQIDRPRGLVSDGGFGGKLLRDFLVGPAEFGPPRPGGGPGADEFGLKPDRLDVAEHGSAVGLGQSEPKRMSFVGCPGKRHRAKQYPDNQPQKQPPRRQIGPIHLGLRGGSGGPCSALADRQPVGPGVHSQSLPVSRRRRNCGRPKPRRGKMAAGPDQRAPKSRSICRALLLKPKNSTWSSGCRTRPDQSNVLSLGKRLAAEVQAVLKGGQAATAGRRRPRRSEQGGRQNPAAQAGSALAGEVCEVARHDSTSATGDLLGREFPKTGRSCPGQFPPKKPEKPW